MTNDELKQLKVLAEAAADKSQVAEVQGMRLNNFKWAASPNVILDLIAKVESLAADAERNKLMELLDSVLGNCYMGNDWELERATDLKNALMAKEKA